MEQEFRKQIREMNGLLKTVAAGLNTLAEELRAQRGASLPPQKDEGLTPERRLTIQRAAAAAAAGDPSLRKAWNRARRKELEAAGQ